MPVDTFIPYTRAKNPKPTKIIPIENFNGVEGSMPLLARAIQSIAKKGAKVKINPAFRD